VEFNEEERAIIRARDLYGDGFTVRAATKLPSATTWWGTKHNAGDRPLHDHRRLPLRIDR